MTRLALLALLVCTSFLAAAQLQSPEQFLGYKIGTRFTPHHRVVDYFRAVAAASPATVKLQQYGTSTEGRPLLLAAVSSAQNIGNLETIRQNNLSITTTGKAGAGAVPIVWLSYNVHGNEASSTEASMLTLFALADAGNAQTKAWLQNTVVLIDPCLNPDGRDRYVNWYNSVVGKNFNPAPESREHREPWPGGRGNHYNFDLNRDWAWQTQVETRQRLAVYNQWMPQVHVDFHEQGYNEPYYFAPAAEPLHEVITPFQRSFQATIGRNHARYFDAAGWLYFTKERFDLLYPSYGDTYPIYNGAIGMTYEQAGIGAGLGVITENGDTLTLVDRAQHHHTTGLSTVEVASKNAAQLMAEFGNYFRTANNGVDEVKAYVLKADSTATDRIQALTELLTRNGIRYYTGNNTGLRGFSYSSNREEGFSVGEGDVVIPTTQPKSALIKVLFEQKTKLSDSATYDITAWSLPYAYGLQAYALRTAPTVAEAYKAPARTAAPAGEASFAYVIPWTGINAAKAAAQLLQKGIKLRYSTEPFTSGGRRFDRGAVIVLRTGNSGADLWQTVRNTAAQSGAQLVAVSSGFVDKGFDFGSSTVVPLKKRRVAMFTGEGISSLSAGETWYFFEQVLHYPVTLVNVNDAARLNWSQYDVVIMPDGAYRFLNDKPAADALRTWLSNGGHLIAVEGGVTALSRLDWAIKAKKADDSSDREKDGLENLRRYNDRERDALKDYTPGSIYRVELDNTHPLAFGYPAFYHTLKMDNNQFSFLKDDGWNVGVVKKDGPVAGFVGTNLSRRLRNHLVFGVQEIGGGTVTYFTDAVLFRSFWENGKLLFANAVLLVGQ